VEEELVKKI
jgi:hypothetical protein